MLCQATLMGAGNFSSSLSETHMYYISIFLLISSCSPTLVIIPFDSLALSLHMFMFVQGKDREGTFCVYCVTQYYS